MLPRTFTGLVMKGMARQVRRSPFPVIDDIEWIRLGVIGTRSGGRFG